MANTLQMTDKISVVLDLGTTKLRAVAAVLDDYNKVSRIIATEESESKGIKHGRVDNFNDLAGVLNMMLKKLSMRIYNEFKKSIGASFTGTNVEIKRVYLALGGDGILGKAQNEYYPTNLNNEYVDVRVVTKIQEDVRKHVENDKEVVLELINQGYNIDDEIRMEPVGCRASNVEGRFCVVTAKKEIKEDIIKTLSEIKVELAGYTLLPFALGDVMLTDADKEVGTTLIDLGASSTSIAIYRDNVRRHVRVLPLGSKLITKDIRNVCGLTSETAENVKIKLGCAYPGGLTENIIGTFTGSTAKIEQIELASIIEARLEELMSFLLGEMDKVNALTATKKIVLTGGGSRLKKICEKFTNEFGLDTEVGKLVDTCYEKYIPYFSSLEEFKGKEKKAVRKMNEYAACLGVLESCILEPCVAIGKKEEKSVKQTERKRPGLFSLVTNMFGSVAEKAGDIIESTDLK